MTEIRKLLIAAAVAAVSFAAAPVGAQSPTRTQNIAEILAEAGNFQTLLAAVEAAGMTDRLTGVEPYNVYPYTVFAPTDDAFAALPEGTIDTLLMPDNRRDLQAILKNHIFPGTIDRAGYYTARGSRISFNYDFRPVNGNMSNWFTAQRVTPSEFDIMAENGTIHVVDSVLLP